MPCLLSQSFHVWMIEKGSQIQSQVRPRVGVVSRPWSLCSRPLSSLFCAKQAHPRMERCSKDWARHCGFALPCRRWEFSSTFDLIFCLTCNWVTSPGKVFCKLTALRFRIAFCAFIPSLHSGSQVLSGWTKFAFCHWSCVASLSSVKFVPLPSSWGTKGSWSSSSACWRSWMCSEGCLLHRLSSCLRTRSPPEFPRCPAKCLPASLSRRSMPALCSLGFEKGLHPLRFTETVLVAKLVTERWAQLLQCSLVLALFCPSLNSSVPKSLNFTIRALLSGFGFRVALREAQFLSQRSVHRQVALAIWQTSV